GCRRCDTIDIFILHPQTPVSYALPLHDALPILVAFETPENKSVFLAITSATALAFFAMVGFEDSVNMAEETHDPHRIFPKVMLTGLGITAVIYVLVSICAVALIPVGELAASSTPLVLVVKRAAPGLPMETI